MAGLEKCESTLTGVTASSQGWSHRSEENPTVVLLSCRRVAFCLWIQLDQNFLWKETPYLVLYLWIYQCTPKNMEETFTPGIMPRICPESAYVPALLPSLACSSFNRETKATHKTKDNTLHITQYFLVHLSVISLLLTVFLHDFYTASTILSHAEQSCSQSLPAVAAHGLGEEWGLLAQSSPCNSKCWGNGKLPGKEKCMWASKGLEWPDNLRSYDSARPKLDQGKYVSYFFIFH